MSDAISQATAAAGAAQALAGAAGSALGLFDEIYRRVEGVRKKRLSSRAYLRAYYFEVINNLEMLGVVNASRFRTEKANSPLAKALVDRLETAIGSAILFSDELDESSELFRFLQGQGQVNNPNRMLQRYARGREESVRTKSFYENILQAVSFTVVKVEMLRRLAGFSDAELEMLNGIMLERRIVNIRERFSMIKEKLDDLKGIKELSR